MKIANLGKLAVGMVVGKIAGAAVQGLVPGAADTSTDELVLVGGTLGAGYMATRPGRWSYVWAGAALGAASPVIDSIAARARAMLPGGGA